MSSGSDEVSHAELGVQTENNASLVHPSVTASLVKVPLVHQSVQTHFSDLSMSEALSVSQSDISE